MSAVPHSPEYKNFEINTLDIVRKKSIWEKSIERHRCFRNVIGNVIKEGDLRADYEQLKKETNPLFRDDVDECNAIDDEQDRKKYVLIIITFVIWFKKTMLTIFSHFLPSD